MKKVKNDLIYMVVLFVLSVVFYFYIIPWQIPLRNMWGADTFFTSRSFPQILSFLMMGLSLLGIIMDGSKLLKMKKAGHKDPETVKEPLAQRAVPWVVFGLILLYGILFDKIGFIWSTLIIPPLVLVVLKCKNWKYYAAVYGFCAVVYIVFRFVLQVVLP